MTWGALAAVPHVRGEHFETCSNVRTIKNSTRRATVRNPDASVPMSYTAELYRRRDSTRRRNSHHRPKRVTDGKSDSANVARV